MSPQGPLSSGWNWVAIWPPRSSAATNRPAVSGWLDQQTRQPAGTDLERYHGEPQPNPCRHQEEEHRKRAVQRHELAVRLDAQHVLVGLRELGAEDGAEDAAGDEEGQRHHETERPDGG